MDAATGVVAPVTPKPKPKPKAAARPKPKAKAKAAVPKPKPTPTPTKPTPVVVPVEPPSGQEILTSAVQAVGELAAVGVTVGKQVLKGALSRLPKP